MSACDLDGNAPKRARLFSEAPANITEIKRIQIAGRGNWQRCLVWPCAYLSARGASRGQFHNVRYEGLAGAQTPIMGGEATLCELVVNVCKACNNILHICVNMRWLREHVLCCCSGEVAKYPQIGHLVPLNGERIRPTRVFCPFPATGCICKI